MNLVFEDASHHLGFYIDLSSLSEQEKNQYIDMYKRLTEKYSMDIELSPSEAGYRAAKISETFIQSIRYISLVSGI